MAAIDHPPTIGENTSSTPARENQPIALSFDLINGAFLPDKMPTNGLRGALRRFFLLVSAT
jgi:hypothetical protein